MVLERFTELVGGRFVSLEDELHNSRYARCDAYLNLNLSKLLCEKTAKHS